MSKNTQAVIRITPEMKRALEEIARKEDRSVASVVRRMLEESLKHVVLK